MGNLMLGCGGEEMGPDETALEPARMAQARKLAVELPNRLLQEHSSFLEWVGDDLLPRVGVAEAETMLWTLPNVGSSTEDLGKIWLALDSIGRPPDAERFFKRSNRPVEGKPEIDFVRLPSGSFRMGSAEGERGRRDAEGPQREVRVAAFELAATPITNAQFEAFDPLHTREDWSGAPVDELDDHPVVNVSWWDAFVFSRWLGARLPSEAEWEYACRAGTTTRFWAGDSSSDLGRVAWYFDNAGERTHAVGAKPASPWGLYDVHGNIFEWVRDSWHDSYVGAPGDGLAWVDGRSPMNVYRGGAWNRYAEYARAAFRGAWLPTERNAYLGFRVARGEAR